MILLRPKSGLLGRPALALLPPLETRVFPVPPGKARPSARRQGSGNGERRGPGNGERQNAGVSERQSAGNGERLRVLSQRRPQQVSEQHRRQRRHFSNSNLKRKQLLQPDFGAVVSSPIHVSEVRDPPACPLASTQLALQATGAQLAPNPPSGPIQHTQLRITDGETGVVQQTPSTNQHGPSSNQPGPLIENTSSANPRPRPSNHSNSSLNRSLLPSALDSHSDTHPCLQPNSLGLPPSATGKLSSYRRSACLAAKNKGKRITSVQRAQEIMCKKFKLAKFASKVARASSTSSSGASSSMDHHHQPPSQQVANRLCLTTSEA